MLLPAFKISFLRGHATGCGVQSRGFEFVVMMRQEQAPDGESVKLVNTKHDEVHGCKHALSSRRLQGTPSSLAAHVTTTFARAANSEPHLL
jgi:hypothetical protein